MSVWLSLNWQLTESLYTEMTFSQPRVTVVLLVIDKGPEPRSKVSSTKPFLNLSTTKSPDGGMDGVKRKRRREEGEGEGEGEEGGEGVKLIERFSLLKEPGAGLRVR